MKQNVDIIVVESDLTQVEEIKRFLKPGSESFQFALKQISSIDEIYKVQNDTTIGAILVNAELVKGSSDFDKFNTIMKQQQIPVVLFSNAMDAEVKQKAVQLNASDFVLNNKLNLFHLPKTLESALKLSQQKQTPISASANYNLFDNIQQPVIVFEGEKPIYYNSKALHLLNEESLTQLKQFLGLSLKSFELTLKGHEYTVQKTDKDGKVILFINPTSETGMDMLVGMSKIVDHAPFLIFKNDHLIFFNEKANHTLLDVELYSSFDQLFSLNTDATNPLIIHRSSKVSFGFNIESMTIAGKDYQLLMLHDAKTEKRADNFPMGKFINAFSHDLKEPVRTSLSYIQLLERKVNKEGAEYVSIIATEMKRMDNLLQNMKMAMSSDDEPLKLSTVNVRSVLESVFKQLKKEIDAADAMIDLSTMPDVQADERKLSVVFTHLIENAVKFRKKDKRCFIEILVEVKPTETIFCVKDNGIGIDQKYHQEIFQPFYRLISFDENPANGLGLYICKSIIEQHRGKIWVESREGFGTSAFFTIPR